MKINDTWEIRRVCANGTSIISVSMFRDWFCARDALWIDDALWKIFHEGCFIHGVVRYYPAR